MLERAYTVFEIKSADQAQRIIEGIASTPEVDRGGHSMDPKGAQFTLPMPFLWQHRDPIGEVFAATVTDKGIAIKARISTVNADAPASLRARIDEAWHSFTAKPPLVRGLSIGWSPLEPPTISKGMRRFAKWIWGETSAVVVPMNAQASITAVKQFDQAASGHPVTPGVSGARGTSMTASERKTEQQNALQLKSARFEELMNDEAQGVLDADGTAERDSLAKEIKSLNATIANLTTLEAAQAALATGITIEPPRRAPAMQIVKGNQTTSEAEKKPWLPFVRVAMATAAGKGSMSDTIAYAKRWQSTMPEVVDYFKAALPGTTDPGSPAWGSQLVPSEIGRRFLELLMPATIVGRLNLVPTPFLTRIIVQTGGSTVDWVGQTAKKPVGELAFTDFTMPRYKIAGIVVLSEELVMSSQPAAEEVVRRDLSRQLVKFMDQQFIDPSVSSGANNPASITNAASPVSASGTSVDALLSDFNEALANFDSTDMGTDGLAIVTTPALARGISMLLSPLGTRQFPEMTPTGGSILGYPVIVSNGVPTGYVVFIKQDQVLLADDGGIRLDASNQATLDMGDDSAFNLWQNNCLGLRAERFINWLLAREQAVQLISGAAYGPAVGSP